MKKRGFTLAEILVTLSIIAIASALLAPAYNKMRPDKYKFKVLDCYRLASEATEALLNNAAIYYRKSIDSSTPSNAFLSNGMLNPNTQWGCNGLRCMEKPRQGSGYDENKYIGLCKYPNLMVNVLKLENVTECAVGATTIGEATGTMNGNIQWTISFMQNGQFGGGSILIDLDPSSSGPNKVYSSTVKNPDRFMFNVSLDGDITGGDPLTRTYLRNMANTDRTADFEEAAQN